MKIETKTILSVAVVALLLVVAVQGVLLFWFYATYNPYVVTNSDFKRFDPKKFQFSHYNILARNEHEFNKALLKMFPPGTGKSDIDEILVKQAHAGIKKNQTGQYHEPGQSDYTYRWGSWLVHFIFDENNKAVAMITNPDKPLYGTHPRPHSDPWYKLNSKGSNHERE